MSWKECEKQETSTKASLFFILFISESPPLIYTNPDFNIDFLKENV